MITYELIESASDIQSIGQHWQKLQEKGTHTPFQEWAWHSAWWNNAGKRTGQTPFFMTVWDNAEIVMILPFCLSKDGNTLLWSAAEVSDYCDVLATTDAVGLIPKALQKTFAKFRGEYITMKQVRSDSQVYGELSQMKILSKHDDVVCPAIRMQPEGYEKWLLTLDRKEVSCGKRLRRRLDEVANVRLKEITSEDAIDDFLSELITNKTGWLERRETKNALCTEEGKKFLADAVREMLPKGLVHMTILQCGDSNIAHELAFINNKSYYYYFGSWDYSWKRYAPGRLHMLDLIRYAHEHGSQEFDLLRGEEEYKNSVSSTSNTLVRFELCAKPPNPLRSIASRIKRKLFA